MYILEPKPPPSVPDKEKRTCNLQGWEPNMTQYLWYIYNCLKQLRGGISMVADLNWKIMASCMHEGQACITSFNSTPHHDCHKKDDSSLFNKIIFLDMVGHLHPILY
jgi:hypothetical protein